ncbi:unnamed protein product, partial [Rotaria sp. Silwood1]
AYSSTWSEFLVSKRNPPYNQKKTASLESLAKVSRNWLPLSRLGFWFWAFAALITAITTRIVVRGTKNDKWKF